MTDIETQVNEYLRLSNVALDAKTRAQFVEALNDLTGVET